MADPKRCPFCNSMDIKLAQAMDERWFGHCESCDACGPFDFDKSIARHMWNHRPPADSEGPAPISEPVDGETSAFLASILDKKEFEGKLDRSRIQAMIEGRSTEVHRFVGGHVLVENVEPVKAEPSGMESILMQEAYARRRYLGEP